MPAIIVHGGAGTFAEETRQPALEACERALAAGAAVLSAGGNAVEAVEAAVLVLEDDPLLDAGHGSYPDALGRVRMDAILVDGATLGFGAVACLANVSHPISVARAVWERTDHCMLAGEDATAFAREQGFPYVADEMLLPPGDRPSGKGTVGAVALDAAGHVAAATSTGGLRGRLPGRVGDSPLIGCGAIAEDGVGAVSATGHGEHLMKILASRTALDFMRAGLGPDEAAAHTLAILRDRTGGEGGLICVDAAGRVGHANSTDHMPHAGVSGTERRSFGI